MGKTPIASVTYENERISIKKKKQLTSHKLCVTSLLCGPWADLWPFYGVPRHGGVVPAGSPDMKPDQNSFFYTHF